MLATVDAAIAELEEEPGVIPDNITMQELVDGVIRGKYKLGPSQLRVLVAWMPHFAPKLSAAAVITGDGKTFAEALERCIERSRSPVPMLIMRSNGCVVLRMKCSRPLVAADHMARASTARSCCPGVMRLAKPLRGRKS